MKSLGSNKTSPEANSYLEDNDSSRERILTSSWEANIFDFQINVFYRTKLAFSGKTNFSKKNISEEVQLRIRKCGITRVLEIINKLYFLEDNLEWIVNPKFQLSSIIGCRDIANSRTHKIQTKHLQTRIWICYILLDFYATELKLSEIEKIACYF